MPKIKITLTGVFFVFASYAQILAQPGVDSTRLMTHLQVLSAKEMAGRKTGTKGHVRAMAYIENEFKLAGIEPFDGQWRHSFGLDAESYPPSGTNILGFLKGESDSLLVVSAHYDHLGLEEGKVFYGADDNASGVAVMLEAARLFAKSKKLPYNMVFAAFDAEEVGLKGAYAFVEQLKKKGVPVKLNLNMDMVSKGYNGEMYVSGTYHYPELKKWVDTTGVAYSKVKLKLGHDLPGTGHDDWTYSSDHGPFHKEKIPFLYFGVEDHPHYHQPSDTFDKTPYSFFLRSAETIVGFLNHYLDHAKQ